METVVVGFVPNERGWEALDAAVAEARRRRGRVVAVHSVHGGAMDDAEAMREARDALAEAGRRLDSAGVPHDMRLIVQDHSAATDLENVAAEEDAALIVIGARHRTRTGKFVLGSDTQEVILTAERPVLVVKHPGS